jgi:hypothetical protein
MKSYIQFLEKSRAFNKLESARQNKIAEVIQELPQRFTEKKQICTEFS